MTVLDRLRRLADELSALAAEVARRGDDDLGPGGGPAVVERFLALVEAGDLSRLAEVLAADVVSVVPGRHRLAGRHVGIDAVRRSFGVLPRHGVRDLGTKTTLLLAGDGCVVTLHELTATVDGEPSLVELALRFRVADDRITEIVELNGDQHATDDVFR